MAYKVVSLNRYSSNSIIVETYLKEKITEILQDKPYLSKLFLRYDKDKWVHAEKDSIGICCFKTKRDAENFIRNNLFQNKVLILKVMGRGKKLNDYLLIRVGDIYTFYEHYNKSYNEFIDNDILIKEPPTGTVFYKKVKVLE